MKKWQKVCVVVASFSGAIVISYQATRTEDVLTRQDVQAWQATGQLQATTKPPIWRDFGIVSAVGLIGCGCFQLWQLLTEEAPPQSSQNPPIYPNSPPLPSSPSPSPHSPTKGDDRREELWQQPGGVTTPPQTQTGLIFDRLVLKKDRSNESYTRPIKIYVT